MQWAVNQFPDVREEPTRISVSTTRALWLDESVSAAHDDAFMPPMGGREFAHVHADGSMHLCVSDAAVSELVKKSWGSHQEHIHQVLFYHLEGVHDLKRKQYSIHLLQDH